MIGVGQASEPYLWRVPACDFDYHMFLRRIHFSNAVPQICEVLSFVRRYIQNRLFLRDKRRKSGQDAEHLQLMLHAAKDI